MQEEGNYKISAEATLNNGEKASGNVIVKYDKTAPDITIPNSDTLEKWTNKSDEIHITVTDSTSGLKEVYQYMVSSEEYKVICEEAENDDINQINIDKYTSKNQKKTLYSCKKGKKGSILEEYDIAPETGDYWIIFVAFDKANNKTTKVVKVRKDINEPIIDYVTKGIYKKKGWNINENNYMKSEITVNVNESNDNVTQSGIDTIVIFRTYNKPFNVNNKKNKILFKKEYKGGLENKAITISNNDLIDGSYFIVTYVKDKAGNYKYLPIKINKDTRKPKITISNPKSGGVDIGTEWINKKTESAYVEVEIEDLCKNQDNGISGVEVDKIWVYKKMNSEPTEDEKKNIRDNNKITNDYTVIKPVVNAESENKKTFTLDAEAITQGWNYIVIRTEDKAGNIAIKDTCIKKDTILPTGSIHLSIDGDSEKVWSKWFDDYSLLFSDKNRTYRKGEQEFTFTYDEDTSGISEKYYRVTNTIDDVFKKKADVNDWIKIENDNSVKVGENTNAVIYMKLVDEAGNENYIRSNGVTVDSIEPKYTEDPIVIEGANENQIYREYPVLQYKINDPIDNENFVNSGIDSIEYKVGIDESDSIKDSQDYDSDMWTTDTTIQVDENEIDYDSYNGKLIIPNNEDFNNNNVKIMLKAIDKSQNVYISSPLSLSIDTTKPTVNVTYKDSTGAEVEPNGRYFNNDVTMVVTVTERNFDADATLFRINGQQVSLNGMTHVGDSSAGGNGDGDTHTYEYRFTGDEANDKDYTVEYVSCTDKAGNASDSVITPQTFTVDKVQPTVSANDAAGYSSSALTYTATVVERNFDEAGAKVLVTKRLNGSLSYENREYPVIWSTSGDTHTAALSFAEDGDYSFTITCTDKAGNQQAAVYTSKEFTVDNVDPVLTSNISEENNNIANKGNIDFEYVYTDINSSNESGMIGYKVRTLAGTAVNDWVPEIKNVNVDGVNGYTIKFHDNATATKLKDGIYTIELTVKDKAGREAKDEKQFSVNRHGSAYSYISSSYTGAVILQQYVKEITDDIEVVVMNCDDITQYQVEVWNSLNEQNILKPDEDYTWKKENSGYVYKEDNSNRESGFTMYSCKIKPEVFSNEGTYTVRVSTKDIADDAAYGDNAALLYNDDTNTDNNMDITTNMDTAQADKIEFTVDRTNPEIVIMDIDNNGKYNLDKKFSFDYADANELDDIKFVRKDGDKVLETITYKPSDLKDLKTGNISAVAKEYDGYQTITISATDKAGNTGSASVKVLVTSNLWIKYINNTPLVVATIVVVAAAAGGIFFVLFRRRRREEQN